MPTQQVEELPPSQAAKPEVVLCVGGCGRSLSKPADIGNRIVLCRSCWSVWLHTMMKLIRVVKEEI
jgi:hypothetical protein